MTRMPISALEIRRQIFHICLGFVIVFLLQLGFLTPFRIFLILVFGILLSWASLRWRIPGVAWMLDKFERKQVRPGKGVITYFIGVLLVLELFPRDVAYASILILAVADGVSSLVGPFGHVKTILSEKKLFEGTFVGAASGAIAAMLFVSPVEAFAAAFVAMFFEATEIRLNQQILNDNVIVPLIAGTVIILLRNFGIT